MGVLRASLCQVCTDKGWGKTDHPVAIVLVVKIKLLTRSSPNQKKSSLLNHRTAFSSQGDQAWVVATHLKIRFLASVFELPWGVRLFRTPTAHLKFVSAMEEVISPHPQCLLKTSKLSCQYPNGTYADSWAWVLFAGSTTWSCIDSHILTIPVAGATKKMENLNPALHGHGELSVWCCWLRHPLASGGRFSQAGNRGQLRQTFYVASCFIKGSDHISATTRPA